MINGGWTISGIYSDRVDLTRNGVTIAAENSFRRCIMSAIDRNTIGMNAIFRAQWPES